MSTSAAPYYCVTQQLADRKRTIKKRERKAPLVDSTLLRFISTQKKQQQQQFGSDNLGVPPTDLARFVDSLTPNVSEERDTTTTSSPTTPSPSSLSTGNDLSAVDQTTDETDATDSSTPSILLGDGQFNHNRVAQKLISIGAEDNAAQLAGERVQNVLLVRTARRRIRDFLRARDSIWNSSDRQSSAISNAMKEQSAMLAVATSPPEYGFDDVVDLLLEYGLTGTDICAILTHSPSVALMRPRRAKTSDEAADNEGSTEDVMATRSGGETLEETLDRSLKGLLCTTLQLRRYDARKVLRSCPGLLSKRGSKSAVQIVSMLSQIGVSASSMARNKAALPVFLSRSPSGLFRLISFLSSDAIRMPVKQIGPLIRRAVSLDLLDAVVPVPRLQTDNSISYDSAVSEEDESDDTPNEVEDALLGRSGELRRQRINELYKQMASTAWTLRDEIGTKDLGKVVAAYPSVLLLDAKEQILPVANYLMDELGICEGDLPSVLQLYPALLGKKISELRKVESFLLSLEVDPENLPSIFRSFPALLTLDVEKDMMPVVEYLRSIGISNVGRFITRLPPVLGYSIEEDLVPKWHFLTTVCMYSSFELSKFPAYFSYPLDRVIKTRYAYLSYKGFTTDVMPVDLILRYGDKDFATKVALDDDGGMRFREFADRLKQERASSATRKQQPNAKSANDVDSS